MYDPHATTVTDCLAAVGAFVFAVLAALLLVVGVSVLAPPETHYEVANRAVDHPADIIMMMRGK